MVSHGIPFLVVSKQIDWQKSSSLPLWKPQYKLVDDWSTQVEGNKDEYSVTSVDQKWSNASLFLLSNWGGIKQLPDLSVNSSVVLHVASLFSRMSYHATWNWVVRHQLMNWWKNCVATTDVSITGHYITWIMWHLWQAFVNQCYISCCNNIINCKKLAPWFDRPFIMRNVEEKLNPISLVVEFLLQNLHTKSITCS